jgi:uncharacterized tellurite resistance protein B-like protein
VARKRKSGDGSGAVLAVVVLVGILISLPTGLQIALGLVVAVFVLIILFSKSGEKTAQTAVRDQALPVQPSVKGVPVTTQRQYERVAPSRSTSSTETKETMVTVTIGTSASLQPSSSYRIPDPPRKRVEAKWIPANKPVTVAGVEIPGGLVYVGDHLQTSTGIIDPCLIDPSKSIASQGNYRQRQMGYWPSYSSIDPAARRAYLNWLAEGRSAPDADIGFVFLFFYGLERRVFVDSVKDPAAKADWPAINSELLRLYSIYSNVSGSFRAYANSLLMWLATAEGGKAYLREVPQIERTYELPFQVRLALGQAVKDKAPIPAKLALAWAKLHPETNLRTPALRCDTEFDKLFVLNYEKAFGQGMIVPPNRTRLKFSYRPASSALQGQEQVAPLGDIPDVSVLTGPIKKLQSLVEETTKELETYSRFVGKSPESRNSLEGLLLLPPRLWPDAAHCALQSLKDRMGEGMVVMSYQDLLSTLDAKTTLTKDKVLSLARALESHSIGMEPDVLAGSKLPQSDDKLVLFAIPLGEPSGHSTPAYQAAALTLQLASAVANADGDFCAKELEFLHSQVETWTHLPPNQLRRLNAHLRLLHAAPASLQGLRAKLEPLDPAAKESIAKFMSSVAQADGVIAPEEIKLLEKLYKALGLEPKRVFSDVHAAGPNAPSAMPPTTTNAAPGFKLDAKRIEALQKDTEAVTVLLANIFQDEMPAPEVVHVEAEAEPEQSAEGLLGLDEQHIALARLLLTRTEWSREELDDAAADLDLMLDGALETLNDAAFDKHDVPFIEGDNPVVVNPELLEKLEA